MPSFVIMIIVFSIIYNVVFKNANASKGSSAQKTRQGGEPQPLPSSKPAPVKTVSAGPRLRIENGVVQFRASPIPWFLLPLIGTIILFVLFLNIQTSNPAEQSNELWIIAVVAGLFVLGSLLAGTTVCRSLRIDSEGVTQKVFFRTTHLTWRQIWDYGFSYAGFGTARLYFSEDRLETNAKGKKLLNDQCCSIRLNPAELKRSGEILDLCRKYTRIYPFLCTEEGMLVGKLADRIEKPILTAEDEIRTQGKD